MKTLTKELKTKIANELINNPTLDRTKLANKYNVKKHNVGAIFASLNRYGKLNFATSKLNKTMANLSNLAVEENGNITIDKWIELSDMDNKYQNADGKNKKLARKRIVNRIVETKLEGTIVSLPHHKWEIEQRINNAFLLNKQKVNFIGVEKLRSTFEVMKYNVAKMKKMKAKCYLGSMSDKIIGQKPNTYSHLILDYCDTLISNIPQIKHIVENNIVSVDGIVAMTFSKSIRQDSLNLTDDYDFTTNVGSKSDYAIIEFFKNLTKNSNFRIV